MIRYCLLFIVYCLLFIVFGCSSTPRHFDGTDEESEYDALQLRGKWEQIVEKNRQQPTQSLACRKVVCLAQYRLGHTDQHVVKECLSDSREVLTSELAAMMMSDVYMQLGMVTMAQRAAFEAMVKKTGVKAAHRDSTHHGAIRAGAEIHRHRRGELLQQGVGRRNENNGPAPGANTSARNLQQTA